MRRTFIFRLLICGVLLLQLVHAQSPSGTINGLVVDSAGRSITNAEVVVVNDATGVKYVGSTNGEGIYFIPNLPPGPYRLQVSKSGFKTLVKPDVVLNVQDALSINFTLPVGAVAETVTVEGGAPLVNTQSASVSTVVDRRFVEDLPLNGRSFNTLLQLTPGVVITPSQTNSPGQFSIAGQRTDANNFTIDGVSANFGVAALPVLGNSGTGGGQAFSALGGTSSLISVEGLQEFRVQTSSSNAEFGRNAGGQILLSTRSGTNDVHAGFYEYFRNDVMDANDWFANHANQPRAPERHNDFGAYLGGPLLRNMAFYFLSYEGAQLRLPQTTVVTVPSVAARLAAPSSLAPFLNAYPQANGPQSADGSTAQFTGSYSNRASLNAGSARVDYSVNQRVSIFSRYNEAPSQVVQRLNSLSQLQTASVSTRTLTVGTNFIPSGRLANLTRANFSQQKAQLEASLDSFGGASPPPLSVLSGGLSSERSVTGFFAIGTNLYQTGPLANNRTRQFNLVDDLSIATGTHQMRFGADYRAIFLNQAAAEHSVLYISPSVAGFLATGQVNVSATSTNVGSILAHALSVYAQDTWKIKQRLTLMYGLRWELSPAPAARNGTILASWTNVQDPAGLSLAPVGTSVWNTVYHNFAPRLGLAYSLTERGDMVVRLGGGIYYDAGSGSSANLLSRFPNFASTISAGVPLPVTNAEAFVPNLSLQPPFSTAIEAFSPKLVSPRSYQWNVALEKSFGDRQTLSATYVGQAGRDLLRQSALFQPNANITGVFLLTGNDAFSNYHALQLQYRRPVAGRVQGLLNYTWSHSLDNASDDVVAGLSNTVISAANDYGNSTFDVRHSLSAGLTIESPPAASKLLSTLTRGWSIDSVLVARTGFPFNLQVLSTSPGTGGTVASRPDIVFGQSVWLSDPTVPGGRRINPTAFAIPITIRQGTEARNDIAGFNLVQIDMSVGRQFSLGGRRVLQFRVDGFNVLNHPNFTNPSGFLEFGPAFLQSTQMLNQGLGGLNPLFQTGGPRSLQISLRITI